MADENKNHRKTSELLSLSAGPSPIIVPLGACKKCIVKKLTGRLGKPVEIIDSDYLNDIEYNQRKSDGVKRTYCVCECICKCDYEKKCECGQRSNKELLYSMENEHGITDHSLHNIKIFLTKYGPPDEISLMYTKDNDHIVYVKWIDHSVNGNYVPNCKFDVKLTGFGWNYGGYGNCGLIQFFEMIGIDKLIGSRLNDKNSLPDIVGEVLTVKRMGPEWRIIKKLTQKDLEEHNKFIASIKLVHIPGAMIVRPITDIIDDNDDDIDNLNL